MKQILLLIIITSCISCAKEKNPSIAGNWGINSVYTIGSTNQIYTGDELILQLNPNGSLNVINTIPGSAHHLQLFNRYTVTGENTVRFYNTNTAESMDADFTLESSLALSYYVRCPLIETYVRK